MNFKFSEISRSRYKGVNEYLIECAIISLSESKYDMSVAWMGGIRTDKDQNDLFIKGSTNCDGYKKISAHQKGLALDIIPVNTYDKKMHTRIFNHFASLMLKNWQILAKKHDISARIVWGGMFGTGWDKPHYEIVYF